MKAEIATKQAMYALLRLHAELGGKIIDNKAEAKQLSASMKHVEAVLKMLAPGYDTRPIAIRRRKANPWFKRGTVYRHAIEVLKLAEKPLTTREVAKRMLQAKRVKTSSPKAVRLLAGSVQSSLHNHRGASVIAHDQTAPVRWSLPS